MPGSVQFVQPVGGNDQTYPGTVARAGTLSELIDLVPAPFRPRAKILINRVYDAAKKSNNARSYLATLQKHKVDNTFPPEIGGRVHTPALQTSKEYRSSAEWKAQEKALDNATAAHKKDMLDQAIAIKTAEVAFLQGQFAEATYREEVRNITKEVGTILASDSGITMQPDGTFAESELPSWAQTDYHTFSVHGLLYPGRAVALAHAATQHESARKGLAFRMKKNVDRDVEMEDAHQNDTIQAIVQRELAKAMQANKTQYPGKGNAKKQNPPQQKKKPQAPARNGGPTSGVKKRGSSNGSSRGRRSNRSTSK